jgi:PmbA protein
MTKILEPLLERMARRGATGDSGSRGDAGAVSLPVDWRLSWTSYESSSVGVRDGQRASVHAPLALGSGFGFDYLFAWEDGRITTGAAERIALADPDRFLALARQAAYEDPDGANFAGPDRFEELPLVSEETAEDARSGGGASFAALLDTGEAPMAARGFRTWSGSVSASVSRRGVLTSRGLDVQSASTHAGYSFWYEGLTGDAHGSRSPVAPSEAAERLERACDLVQRLGSPQRAFEGGTMSVLLHPKVAESFLFSYLLANIHGDRIHHGQSAFRIGQFGSEERTFAPGLSLRLEPSVPMDTGSYRFTTEGVPARALAYVEDGRLVEPILDLKYARRMGRSPVPGPLSSDSLRLTGPRTLAEDEALAAAGRGVLVLSVLGLHTQDSTRGDFSISAPQTLAIEGGALGGAVKAVLTGNLFEALRDPRLGLVAFAGYRMPGLLFTGSVGVDSEA